MSNEYKKRLSIIGNRNDTVVINLNISVVSEKNEIKKISIPTLDGKTIDITITNNQFLQLGTPNFFKPPYILL